MQMRAPFAAALLRAHKILDFTVGPFLPIRLSASRPAFSIKSAWSKNVLVSSDTAFPLRYASQYYNLINGLGNGRKFAADTLGDSSESLRAGLRVTEIVLSFEYQRWFVTLPPIHAS